MIKAPPHEFDSTGTDPMVHTVIVTPELQAWAADAAEQLRSDGWPVPTDLDRLCAGQALTRHYWVWLLDYVRAPRPPCPF